MQPNVLTAEHSAAELPPANAPRITRTRLARATDERLVELSRNGEEAAFEALVQRHRPAMDARCRRMLDPHAAEDAVQLAFVSAWRALQDGCEVTHVRPWLHTIAHRSALQWIRARPDETEAIPELIASPESPADQLELRLDARETLAALAGLPVAERDALLLAAVQGHSGRYTAHALGVSEGAVRQLVFRARARMRNALAAPLAWPLLAGLVSRLRTRATGSPHVAGAGARSGLGVAPLLGRAAAVLVAGAIAGTPLVLHTGGGSAPPVAAGHLRMIGSAPGAAAAAVAPTRASHRARQGVLAHGTTQPTARRGGAAPQASRNGAGGVAGTSPRTDPARSAAADGGHAAGTVAAGASGSKEGLLSGAPIAGRGPSGGAVGEAVGTVTSGAGAVVQGAGKAAGGAVSGITRTAESVVGQVAGTVSTAAPVVAPVVQGAGTTVTQTVNKTGEAVTGLVEHVTAPTAPASEEEHKTLLGGLLGR